MTNNADTGWESGIDAALDAHITRMEARHLAELYDEADINLELAALAAGFDLLERAMSPGGVD